MIRRAAALLGLLLLAPATGRAHAGSFILAKCAVDPGGVVTLALSTDYSAHPLLTNRDSAVAAMHEVLRLETPSGPVRLDAVADPVLTDETVPDTELPLPAEDGATSGTHQFTVLRWKWRPATPEIRFSVPAGNPHDVLFLLKESGRGAGEPAPWRILIAGDRTPPIPLPVAGAVLSPASRTTVAVITLAVLFMLVRKRRLRLSPRPPRPPA